jgi:hypothetical protein
MDIPPKNGHYGAALEEMAKRWIRSKGLGWELILEKYLIIF